MLIRADSWCNTAVCLDPPDIESGFELALDAWLLRLGRFSRSGGGAATGSWQLIHCRNSRVLRCQIWAFCQARFWWLAKLTWTAFRSLLSLATAATTNFELCKQFQAAAQPTWAPTPRNNSTNNATDANKNNASRVARHAPLVARRVAEQRGLLPP